MTCCFFCVAALFVEDLRVGWRAFLTLFQRCFWTLILLLAFFMPLSIAFSFLFSLSSLLIFAVNLGRQTLSGGLGIGEIEPWAGERLTGLKDTSSASGDGGVISKMAARSSSFFLFLAFVFFHCSQSFVCSCFGRLVIFRGWISPLVFFSWYLLMEQRQLFHVFYTSVRLRECFPIIFPIYIPIIYFLLLSLRISSCLASSCANLSRYLLVLSLLMPKNWQKSL